MNEKLSILHNILGRSYKSNGEHLFACPYCGHPKNKFSINIEKNVYKCWICDARGKNLFRVIKKFGNRSQLEHWKQITGNVEDLNKINFLFQKEEKEEKRETILSMPEGFKTLTRPSNSRSYRAALRYLSNRGIEKIDILRWKMGYCDSGKFKDRIIIPSFNLDGNLNYYIARTYADNYKRYLNPSVSRDIVFNELNVDFDREITIVEGVFDAIKASNAVPILGSTIRETSKLFKKILQNDTPVLLALDPDASKKTNSIRKLILKYGIEVRQIKYQDRRDLGEMTKQEVKLLSNNAPYMDAFDGLIEAINSL
jgi:DNA primase